MNWLCILGVHWGWDRMETNKYKWGVVRVYMCRYCGRWKSEKAKW